MGEWDHALKRIAAGEDVQFVCDDVSRQQTERVRAFLRKEGREDLVAELDQNLKDNRLGLTHARAVWHSISAAQRRVILLLSLGVGRILLPKPGNRNRYGMCGGKMDAVVDVCGAPTVRCLHARSLVEPTASNVFHYTLTEHGRFVLKHGPTNPRALENTHG